MTLIDQNGRLFGRVNLIDAVVLALVGVLIPIAYASYLLFRTPPATLTGVEPEELVMGPNPRVRVNGTNLRPFMRVSFNDEQGRTFLIGSTTSAEVDLPQLEPGTYDVVLYDYAQELSRLPKALTIVAPAPAPTAKLVVSGSFIGLTEVQAAHIKAGAPLEPTMVDPPEILAAGASAPATARVRSGATVVPITLHGQFKVPAVLRLTCWLETNPDGSVRCVTSGRQQLATVTRDAIFTLPTPHGDTINFQVDEVFPADAPQFSVVRVQAAQAQVVENVRSGDRDSAGPLYDNAWVGTVDSVDGSHVTLRLPVQRVAEAWHYREQPLKIGRGLRFETPTYVLDGIITAFTEPKSNDEER